jgi:hypothetical protein
LPLICRKCAEVGRAANRLAAGSAESTKDKVTDKQKEEDALRPTQIAERVRCSASVARQADLTSAQHGNEPSRGAKIDEQIQLEVRDYTMLSVARADSAAQEEAELKKKGKA